MSKRLIFLPIAAILAGIAIYFDFTYAGFGVLIGIALPFWWSLRGESIHSPIEMGGVLALVGVACYIGAKYVATKHGLTLEELDKARDISKFIRRLPYYSISAMTCGIVLIILGVLAKRDGD